MEKITIEEICLIKGEIGFPHFKAVKNQLKLSRSKVRTLSSVLSKATQKKFSRSNIHRQNIKNIE